MTSQRHSTARSKSKRLLAAAAALLAVLAFPGGAFAHNAGHIFLPDGSCREVGSFREAPLVGQDRTQLDFVPGGGDQYGVSFVGTSGGTPILPGGCPAALTSSVATDQSSVSLSSTSQSSSAGWGR